MTKKYERTAYLKIWYILEEIQHQRLLKTSEKRIKLSEERLFQLSNGCFDTIDAILRGNLSESKRAIEIKAMPDKNRDYYIINIIAKNFNPYFKKIEKIYEKSAREFEQNKQIETKEIELSSPEAIVYWIDYSEKSREIRINNLLLSKPDFDSKNEIVFTYLYNNPNKRIDKKEIEKETKEPINKRLHNIINELGFSGELKKAFFSISKTSIEFRNPIKRKDLQDLGINWVELKPKQRKKVGNITK